MLCARWHRKRRRPHKGLEAIVAWRRETADKYQHTFEPLAVTERDGKTIVTTKVTGSFPAAQSRSTLFSVLRTARLHRWKYSLDGCHDLKGETRFGAVGFPFGEKSDVRFWPLTDIRFCAAHVRSREQSGHALLHCICPLMTQSGHTFLRAA
jgi:hypothetical protein